MRVLATALCLLVSGLGLFGCGSGGGSESGVSGRGTTTAGEASKAQKGKGGKGEQGSASARQGDGSKRSSAPVGPRVQALARNFPKPKPSPGAGELSAKGIAAGEEACRGLAPAEVKDRFFAKAEANLDPDQIQLIEELPKYEEEAPEDASFVAGQIAATIYGASLPDAQSQYGFQGCVYALVQRLEEGIAGR